MYPINRKRKWRGDSFSDFGSWPEKTKKNMVITLIFFSQSEQTDIIFSGARGHRAIVLQKREAKPRTDPHVPPGLVDLTCQ
jgi:hypothetical protein